MASTTKFCQEKKITCIVNAAGGLEKMYVGWALHHIPALEKTGIQFLRLGWNDAPQQLLWKDSKWDQLIEAITFVDGALRSGNNVLVHCAQGKSRSGTIVVAYYMAKQQLNVEESLKVVKQKRSMVEPNSGFLQQLHEFEQSTELQNLRQVISVSKVSSSQ